MKQLITLLLILAVTAVAAQETKTKGSFLGSIESNSQVYLKDSKRNIEVPDDPFRSNTYLQLQYNYKKWTVGVQGEAYLPKALLNLNPKHKGVGVGTAFVNYKSTKLDITAGHFYEQFGSGLLLRSWEDRFLGINNAILGGRIKYSPVSQVRFIAVAGKQRSGFDISNGIVFGMDAEIDILSVSEKQQSDLSLGISYVGRNEDFKTPLTNPTFKETTNGLSGRLNYSKKGFTASAEYVHKSKDGILYDKAHVDTTFVKPGSALLLNMGYAKKGTGFNITLRRIENMSFYSEREPEILEGNESSIYFNDKMINYIPSLTKQHHFNLANIYVYQAQQLVSLDPSTNIGKAGDVGGMIDFFHNFKKGSKLGGKNGTKIEITYSNYNNLSGDYVLYPPAYDTKKTGTGQKFFSDFSIEVSKKIKTKWHGSIAFTNQYYNNSWIEGTANKLVIKTNILATDWEHKLNKNVSLKWVAEHMWADNDRGNWIAGSFEMTLKNKISFFISDMFNYGYEEGNNLIDHLTDPFDIHFYNIGGSYKTGTLRVSLNYGRQRGGLVCTGGVCRIVMPSTGFGLSLTKTFKQKAK